VGVRSFKVVNVAAFASGPTGKSWWLLEAGLNSATLKLVIANVGYGCLES
jgi:hypothetical protein